MNRPILIEPPLAQRLSVLVAEDDDDTRQELQRAVRSLGYSCGVARDGLEAWQVIQAGGVDVVLSDWAMPRLDGLGLCQRLRSGTEVAGYTHFIFITGNSDKAHFITGMQAGADDYITKPVDMDDLEARLEVCRRAVMNQRHGEETSSALRRKSDHNFHAARTDPLTCISNRLELTEDLEVLASHLGRYNRPYSAAMCDIDRFKAYNDFFGHLAGDDVLRLVAHTVRDGLRRGDGFYRYGGEEFVAILRDQTLEEASSGMDRVRQDVEKLCVAHAPGVAFPFVTISVGIAEISPESREGTAEWLHRADDALYRAKATGRNRVVTERDVLLVGD
jgi:two-component system chemotaxis response regulator CheY